MNEDYKFIHLLYVPTMNCNMQCKYCYLKENTVDLEQDDTYLKMIKDYSQSMLVTIRADIDVSKFFKYYNFEREAKISGVNFKIYKVYEGSSQMDKNEFRVLLDGVIQEAQQLGIPTLTPAEIERLKWIENDSNRFIKQF